MAKRRKIYEWDKIKAEYELGKPYTYLCEKYEVPKSSFFSRVKRENWQVLESQKAILSNFKESCDQISDLVANADENKKEAVLNDIEIALKNSELIKNNRTLLKDFQLLLNQGLKDGIYQSPSDIKQGVSAIKDIEAVANPTPKVEINNTNTQITQIKRIIVDERSSD